MRSALVVIFFRCAGGAVLEQGAIESYDKIIDFIAARTALEVVAAFRPPGAV